MEGLLYQTAKALIESQVSQVGNVEEVEWIDLSNPEHVSLLVNVMKKPLCRRSRKDKQLVANFFSNAALFENFRKESSEVSINQLASELAHMYAPAGTTLFNIGDRGRQWFYILQGDVSILVPSSKINNSIQKNENSNNNEDQPTIATIELSDGRTLEFENFKVINEVHAGDAFGEIALRQNIPRTATVVTKTDCHFATLTADAFQKILGNYYDRIHRDNIDFMKSIPTFKEWPKGYLEIILHRAKLQQFNKNQTIYAEGEKPQHIYIIKSGDVEISKSLEIPNEFDDDHDNSCYGYKIMSRRNNNAKRCRVMVLSSTQMFGDEELLARCPRKSMAKCISSEAWVYAIRMKVFLDNFPSEKLLREFVDDLNHKTSFHQALVNRLIETESQISAFPKVGNKDNSLMALYSNMNLHANEKCKAASKFRHSLSIPHASNGVIVIETKKEDKTPKSPKLLLPLYPPRKRKLKKQESQPIISLTPFKLITQDEDPEEAKVQQRKDMDRLMKVLNLKLTSTNSRLPSRNSSENKGSKIRLKPIQAPETNSNDSSKLASPSANTTHSTPIAITSCKILKTPPSIFSFQSVQRKLSYKTSE